MKPIRPVLRYHGGKWRLAPWIISHFPAHRIYVEPFGGGASVLMRKDRAYAEVYNDLDSEVVNVFRILRDPAASDELERVLRLTPYSRLEFDAAFEPSPDPVEQARRTCLKSFGGFGSDSIHRGVQSGMRTSPSMWKSGTGFRSDCRRSGTTPAHDWGMYSNLVKSFSERLQGVVIECRPAIDVILQYDSEETLFYVDPPYLRSTRVERIHGYRHEMTEDQHRELSTVLRSVHGMVVVSGYPSSLYDDWYSGWRRVETKARAHRNSERTEVLWISPNVPVRDPELFISEVGA